MGHLATAARGLNNDLRRQGAMRLGLLDGQAIKQPVQLLSRDTQSTGRVARRPTKPALFQSLIEQPEAVLIPKQDFDLAAIFAAEDEELTGKRVLVNCIGHQSRQRIDGFPHVSCTRHKPDLLGNNFNHDSRGLE